MSKKRRKSLKPWRTRGFFIFSTLSILVISGAVFGGWLLSRRANDDHIVADVAWMDENIWRVESYKERKNGEYDVYLLQVQPAYEPTFEDLQYTFYNTRYSSFNSYYLADGVNCQGMVCYIADWCERNLYEYSVSWDKTHTWAFVNFGGDWHKFDFDSSGASIEQVSAKYVTRGMIIE